MAENTAKKTLYNLNETFTNIVEYVLSYFYVDSGGGEKRLDVLNMFLAGWVLLGIFVYLLGTFIANAIDSGRENVRAEPEKSETESSEKEVSKSDLKEVGTKPKAKSVAAEEEKIVCRSIEEVSGAPRIGALSGVPIANGKDAGSVRWINLILVWIHTTPKLDLLLDCWIHSINERAAEIASESGNVVTFEKLLEGCPLPELRDVRVSGESSNNVTVTSDVLAKRLSFLLLATRNKGKDKTTSEYLLNIDELNGKLKVTCNTEDKLLVVKFVDKPDVKINLKLSKSGALKESGLDERALEDWISDVAVRALGSAVVDLHLSQDPDFPNYVKDKGSISPSSFGSAVTDTPDQAAVARHEQRLFVKVIKASNLGADKGCQEAYCVVEMDDPPQKFQTAPIKATISPFWDEHFLFNLKNSSAEVLFEIFDKSKPAGENFLGLGIVSVEELLKNPSQRQIISLQPRPMENDKVTGSLTAEFLFMEGSEIPIRQQAGRTVETNSRVTPQGKIITTTTIKKSDEEDSAEDSEPLTDTALKEIEQMGKTGMSTNKSTLIIHSVQREIVRPTLKVKVDKDGRWHEVPAPPQANGDHSGSGSPQSPTAKAPSATGSASSSDKEDRSGRAKERKSFVGTLRKRFSFKKNRSKSVDPNGVDPATGGQSPGGSRGASNDRSKSAPGSREQSAGRQPSHLGVPGRTGSARSSISEGSGFSGASSRTYINENSTLVIEINENGITKHYLIPFSLATRSKWRKRGIKLHIYNDHTFVAKHVSGSVMCQVCTRHFPRRPGKQAYSCRDCDLQVHKTCHVKVEGVCPNSTIQSLEMEYVQDPRVKSTSS